MGLFRQFMYINDGHSDTSRVLMAFSQQFTRCSNVRPFKSKSDMLLYEQSIEFMELLFSIHRYVRELYEQSSVVNEVQSPI